MSYLLDTNILIRHFTEQKSDDAETVKQREEIKDALRELNSKEELLYYSPHILKEIESVAMKSKAEKGFGCSKEQTDEILKKIETTFRGLPDEPERIKLKTDEIKERNEQRGTPLTEREEADLPIVATMEEHNVKNILTFNTKDFKKHEQLTAWTPLDIKNNLQLNEIENPQKFNQLKSSQKNTLSYAVKLNNGQASKVNINGLTSDRAHSQEARNNLYSEETVNKIKSGEKEIQVKAPEAQKEQPPAPQTVNQKEILTEQQETKGGRIFESKELLIERVSETKIRAVLSSGKTAVSEMESSGYESNFTKSLENPEFRHSFVNSLGAIEHGKELTVEKKSETQSSESREQTADNTQSEQQVQNQQQKNTQSY